MPDYNERGRAYRTRADMREPSQRDWVTAALAAQVALCLIVAVSLLVMKKLDNTGYADIKQQYAVMLSDNTQMAGTAEFFNEKSQGLSGFLAKIRELFTGKTPDGEERAEENSPVPETAPSEGSAVTVNPAQDMQFDYLKDTAESESRLYLSESWFSRTENGGGQILPPQGSTLSPIYLSTRMNPPVTGIITSGFSYREHPLTGGEDFHTGLDIAADKGTPILAALQGEVVEVGESQIYGKYIVLQHATNLRTSYSHCSEIIASEGMAVRQGERIALVGETGVATGPHLHFSVIVEDEFADPSWVLQDYIKLVDE